MKTPKTKPRSSQQRVVRRRCADCDALLSPYEIGPVCASCKVARDDPEEPRTLDPALCALKKAEYWAIKDRELCRPGSEAWMVHDYRRATFAEAISHIVGKSPNEKLTDGGLVSTDCK